MSRSLKVCVMIVVVIVCALFLLLGRPILEASFPQQLRTPSEINVPPLIQETGVHPANFYQNEATVQLTVYDNKLYFYMYHGSSTIYDNVFTNHLSVLEDGGAKNIVDYPGTNCIGMNMGMIYYTERNRDTLQYDLYAYSLDDGSTTFLCQGVLPDGANELAFFQADGTFYMSADRDYEQFYPIYGLQVGELQRAAPGYLCSGMTYRVVDAEVIRSDAAGNEVNLKEQIPYGTRKTLMPYGDGLLVYNEGQGDLLYFIDGESGEIHEVFTFPCMVSVSAFNYHGDYAYLSFKRYEKHGDFGMLRYEDDTLEGTWRIDLRDFSAEKLSDEIYCGLYVFDDSGIYACNEKCEVFLLNFDGDRVMTILNNH